MTEKRRFVPVTGFVPYTYGGIPSVASPFGYTQVTQSRGHAWPSAKRALTDVGGDFSSFRVTELDLGPSTYVDTGDGLSRYQGIEYAFHPGNLITEALGAIPKRSEIYFAQLGSKAISQCIPTNPVADAGTFIGELKEGLPSLPGKALLKSKFKDHRQVGSEYLNIEFGWKPIISDLQKFGKAAIESDKILKQLHRDSGRNVRRKFTFPDEKSTLRTTGGNYRTKGANGSGFSNATHYSSTGGAWTRVMETTTRSWFSGCFTYHLNLGSSLPDKLDRHAAEARKLFGAELTPATVWNLAPWSWAIDWQGNIGDVLHNVSRFAQDGLVMRYGYIMQETTCKITYTVGWQSRFQSAPKTDLTCSVTVVNKERRRATPFGFGFDMQALTGRQLSILGALGISRSPRHL